ncbi:UNVERIFIED_CONTAM: hypothetical protein Sradi_2361900 [Sesamum radiatum]|uniref:Uncharacterized protein n=1 Tax=Sesamum radiatum TaxID=300843 RepID=A0AAW2T966_SESRA
MLMYFAALARRASNLATGFLARDLKKSPSKSPCEKALAFTSCVAAGTSSATALNRCSTIILGNGRSAAVQREFVCYDSVSEGTPCHSSSGAPSIWYFTSCRPFADAQGERAIAVAPPEVQVGGYRAFCRLAAQGLGPLPHPLPPALLPQVVELTSRGLLQTHALVGQPPQSAGWLQVMRATVPPWRCHETCFDDEGRP